MTFARNDLVILPTGETAKVVRVEGRYVVARSFVDGTMHEPPARCVTPVLQHRPHRETNPVVPFIIGICAGAALIFFKIGGAFDAEYEFEELDECQGGILLFGPQQHFEYGIDISTGRWGFCHVGLYLCLTDGDGNQLICDSQRRVGVQLRSLSEYDDRPVAFVPLSAVDTAYARGRAIDRLGKPYRGRPGGMTCSEFVYDCLPTRLQQKIRNSGRLITPNAIAKAFGVPRNSTREVVRYTRDAYA